MDLWFEEKHTPNLTIGLKVRATLHREKTPFQDLAVIDTFQFGRALILDGVIQTTEGDEFVYHEMITHVPLFTHPDPRRVLVIGGGDGGTVREILKHPGVERVTLVEIDRRVIEVSRELLPGISGRLDDPRVEIVIGDGIEYTARAEGEFDVIIVDSTDPVGPAVGLFAADFYRSVFRALRPDGLFVAQTESPFINEDLIRRVLGDVRGIFPLVRMYTADVPTYPCGLWSFTLGSRRYDPLDVAPERFFSIETRYYTPEVHRRAFMLPRFVAALAGKSGG